jgi:hypothetical protein
MIYNSFARLGVDLPIKNTWYSLWALNQILGWPVASDHSEITTADEF